MSIPDQIHDAPTICSPYSNPDGWPAFVALALSHAARGVLGTHERVVGSAVGPETSGLVRFEAADAILTMLSSMAGSMTTKKSMIFPSWLEIHADDHVASWMIACLGVPSEAVEPGKVAQRDCSTTEAVVE
jgi:hypothetical protein